MSTESPSHRRPTGLAALRRFMRRRSDRTRCELCSADLADRHEHLLELASRRLVCACGACAILFSNPAAPRYRRVRSRAERLADFRMTDVQWQGLGLPINLAFFTVSSAAGRIIALYPSPAGATEALPPSDAWLAVVEDNPALSDLEPDVEALLVNRLGPVPEHYRVGIDECYVLVGVVRKHWRGLSGGATVWEKITQFFSGLGQRSRTTGGGANA